MRIAVITGVTRTEELTVTKSIGSLIIGSTLALADIENERISIMIERGNGSNVILLNKIKLKDFILASTFGASAVQSDGDLKTIAVCELAFEGSIYLADKESIKILLEDLDADETYNLNGVEEPVQTNELYFIESKSIASEEVNKKVDVAGFDLAIMTTSDTISDISYQFVNGQVVKYLPKELQALTRDIDPIQYVDVTGNVVQGISDRLTLPLPHVNWLEVNKSQGDIINFVVRTLKAV
ncbi:hypothetical protein ACM55H_11630 [Flavobacterium sp. ZT3R17]|uniref:hypothetical protein n=1 Tax=Flavobacterium cryoconiti TaxID=3398736 RepID=UPI003A8BF690